MRLSKIIYFVELGRVYMISVPVVAGIVGVLTPLKIRGLAIGIYELLISILAGLCLAVLHSTCYTLNQICDIDIDLRHKEKCKRPIPSGRITLREAKAFFIAEFSLSLMIAFSIASAGHIKFMLLFLLIMFLGFTFNIRRIKGDWRLSLLWMSISRGPLPYMAYWSIYGDLLDPILLMLIPYLFVWVAAYNHTKDMTDIEADRSAGIMTLPVIYGFDRVKRVTIYISLPLIIWTVALSIFISQYLVMMIAIIILIIDGLDREAWLENNFAWNMFYMGLVLIYILVYIGV